MDGTIGEIRLWAGNQPPVGWAFCHGQELQASGYNGLFALLGSFYGGDGRTKFNLPDLRGRAPMHAGTGPGLSARNLGAKTGAENTPMALLGGGLILGGIAIVSTANAFRRRDL